MAKGIKLYFPFFNAQFAAYLDQKQNIPFYFKPQKNQATMEIAKIKLAQCSETAMQLQDDQFDIIVDRPIEKGGGGKGLMGGQYLLTGIGGCFCSTLFAAAQSRDIQIEGLKVEVHGTMSEELPKRFTHITLMVSYQNCSHPAEFPKLLKIAEKGCISINTIKSGLSLVVTQIIV